MVKNSDLLSNKILFDRHINSLIWYPMYLTFHPDHSKATALTPKKSNYNTFVAILYSDKDDG